MASSTERVLADLQHVVAELEGLVKGAVDATGERAGDAAENLQAKLSQARERLLDAQQSARREVKRGMRAADNYVHDNTWELLGIAAAIAFVAGFLVGRRG